MDVNLTDEQRALVESTAAVLARHGATSTTRRLIDSAHGFDAELWRLGAELGWTALAVPEADGGLGQQVFDLALVAVEHGRRLASTPFIPTVVVADALTGRQFEGQPKILRALVEGSASASWAFAEHKRPWSIDGIRTRAVRQGQGYVLSGEKAAVQDADSARWLLIDTILDEQPARFVVSAEAVGLRVARHSTLDVTRSYCDVTLDDLAVSEDALIAVGPRAAASIERSGYVNLILVCAELVGIGQQLLEMTVAYMKDRVQFGRPIGSFQAVKHKCANMRMWSQSAVAVSLYAAKALDADAEDLAKSVSAAKVVASEAVCRIAGEALQLHGGIGFTWEHDLHLYLRRARTNAMLYGDATHHRERLCALLEEGVTPDIPKSCRAH